MSNILKKNDIDIYKPKWVQDSIKYKKLMPKSPFYLLHPSLESRNYFSKNYDSFGDSYFENVNKETLREIFENIKIDNKKLNNLNIEDMRILDGKVIKQKTEEILILNDEEYKRILKELKQDFPNSEWLKELL